jgi:hypothetical protein
MGGPKEATSSSSSKKCKTGWHLGKTGFSTKQAE